MCFHSAEHRSWLFFFSINYFSLSFSLPKTITPPHFLHYVLLLGITSVMRNVRFSPFRLKGRVHQGLFVFSRCPSCSAAPQHFKNKLWWGLFPVLQSYITVKLQDMRSCNSGGVASYVWFKMFLRGQMGNTECPIQFIDLVASLTLYSFINTSYSRKMCVSLYMTLLQAGSECVIYP